MRIGQGWDNHRIKAGRPLILGGVTIPCDFGLDGHSDADILLHAITDALLGSVALGDIGMHFPDTDPMARRGQRPVCPARPVARHPARLLHRQPRLHRHP